MVWYYLWFQASTGGLETCPPRIREGNKCTWELTELISTARWVDMLSFLHKF